MEADPSVPIMWPKHVGMDWTSLIQTFISQRKMQLRHVDTCANESKNT
jgi:hypothetical protein